jgi:hypothetical protein
VTGTLNTESPAVAINLDQVDPTAADWLERADLHYHAADRQHAYGNVPLEYTAQEIALAKLALELAAGTDFLDSKDRGPNGLVAWYQRAAAHYAMAVDQHVSGDIANEYTAQQIALAMFAVERASQA